MGGWVGGWDDDSKWCGCQWVGVRRCRCGSCMLECMQRFHRGGGVGPAAARHRQPIASWLLRLEKWCCVPVCVLVLIGAG